MSYLGQCFNQTPSRFAPDHGIKFDVLGEESFTENISAQFRCMLRVTPMMKALFSSKRVLSALTNGVTGR